METVRTHMAFLALPLALYLLLYTLWPTSHYFLPDDAFYYFEIARNIAAGKGSTFDGINPTNGYHPLWCGVLTLLGMLRLSRDAFVAAVLALQVLMLAGAVVGLYRCCVRERGGASLLAITLSVLWLGNFYVSKALINGLESALFVLLSVAFVARTSKRLSSEAHFSACEGLVCGALGGLVVLSRLDSYLLVAALCLMWLLTRRRELRREWPALATFLAVPVLVLGVYMSANQLAFGLPMPISGYLKRLHWSPGFNFKAALGYAVFAVVGAAAYLHAARRGRPEGSAQRIAYGALSLFVLLYQADSALVRGVLVPEVWYLALHAMWGLATLWIILGEAATTPRRAPAWVTLSALAAIAAMSWVIRLDPQSYGLYAARREMSTWMNAHLPADTVVAGWDVGQIGYYCDLPVINLDGLVNSYDYAKQLQRGEGFAFLDRSRVTYIAQHYDAGFEHFSRVGYPKGELQRRASRVVWSTVRQMAPLSDVLVLRARAPADNAVQVRAYEPAALATTAR